KFGKTANSTLWGDVALLNLEDLRPAGNFGEGGGIGASHPDLRTQARKCLVKRRAPRRVEMRHDFIKQENWRKTHHLGDQPCMRQYQSNQQRLLLRRGCVSGGNFLR